MIRRALTFFIAIILYALLALILLISTRTGTEFVFFCLNKYIQVERVEGTLIHHVVLYNLRYTDPTFSFKIKRLELDWQPLSLLHKTAHINFLLLDTLKIHDTDTPTYFNIFELPLHWKIKNFLLQDFSYERNTLLINANGSVTSRWNMEWQIRVKELAPWVSQTQGALFAKGIIFSTHDNPIASADITTSQLKIQHQRLGRIHSLFNITVSLPHFPETTGHVQVDDLRFIKLIAPQITSPQGNLSFNFTVRGTAKKPRVKGSALLQGAFSIPSLGIRMTDVKFTAESNEKNDILYSGNATSEGSMKIEGKTLFTSPTPHTTWQVTTDRFLIANTNEYKIIANTALQITLDNHQVFVKGDVIIPEATLSPHSSGESLALSNDIVYMDEEDSLPLQQMITSEIHLVLGDHVNVNFNGIKGSARGELFLTDLPSRETSAKGEITLSGIYHAFNQDLTLSQAQLLFNDSPVSNPTLDIQATKKVTLQQSDLSDTLQQIPHMGTLTVGLNVQGPLMHKQVSLFSEPAVLKQADILSYLLLDIPVTQATENNGKFLYHAANLLNLGEGRINKLSHQLQRTFGLDVINIGSTTATPSATGIPQEVPTLTLGKVLSPKLYISYSLGQFQEANVLRLRYLLSDRWTAISETSSVASSVDLFYVIERNP